KPAAAAAAAAGAKPAEATAAAGAAAGATAKPATPAAAAQGSAVSPAKPVTPAKPGAPATPAGARPPAKPAPSRPAPPRPSSSPSQTAILPPSAAAPEPWFRRVSPRYLVLLVAGVLISGGGAAFALTQLGKSEAPAPKESRTERFQQSGGGSQKKGKSPAVIASHVTVSVLNGTTVPGLAAKVGDKVDALGFQLGNVTNNSDQSRNESVVLYAPGHQREAASVARKLGISQREPIDAASQSLAGDAGVVVVAGTDQI
ncbi:MAG: LytR C-terminal domain-containing protein, partial [Thermoleophilaceae bacterium]